MTEIRVKKKKINQSFGDTMLSVFCYVFFAICAFLCLYPFYYIFINTISANDISARGDILFWPKGIHFKNYKSAFGISGLFQAAKISVGRTFFGTIGTVSASAFLGFMFSQEKMWHRKLWYRIIIATMYFNAGIIPWFLTMQTLHLTNNFWGFVLPAIVSPFHIVLTKTFVESIPRELQEAAEIDGAGIMTIFFKVMIPVIKPIMATVAIFAAVNQWNAFQDALLLITSDTKLYPLQLVLYNYLNQASSIKALANTSSSSSLAAAAATTQTATSIRMTITVIVVLPIMMVYPFFQKYFVKGIMIGAVKG